jgi:hypothetical protein
MQYTIKVNTVGSAGSAAGATALSLPIAGYLEAVKIDYNGSAPATTDVNVVDIGGIGRTLLIVSNSNTDTVYYPQPHVASPLGVVSSSHTSTPYYLDPVRIQVGVAGCDALTDAVIVTIQVRGVH